MAKLRSIDAQHFRIPLDTPASDSTHGVMTSFELITAVVADADGQEGVGYTYTTGHNGGAIHHLLAKEIPGIVADADCALIEAVWQKVWWALHYGGRGGAAVLALSALDMALWDLKAKLAGEPLWRTLGARDRFVPAYASALEIAIPDDELDTLYAEWISRGFTSVKVKGGLDLDTDLVRLARVRDLFSANTPRPGMMLDANESWNRKQAIRYICAVEEQLDLSWVEEPLRRWDADGLAMVSRAVRAGVATGENLTGLEQFKPLFDAGAVDIVQVGSMWGITNFLRVATVAHSRDLPVSPVGSTANPVFHAAAAVPNHLAAELQDLGAPLGMTVDYEIADGGIVLGDQPGHGTSIDESRIAQSVALDGWTQVAGPHVRPDRAGLRLVPDGTGPREARQPR
jgi:L-alanine-DL-glutamate epimerase-like enolase superfamily enzyme